MNHPRGLRWGAQLAESRGAAPGHRLHASSERWGNRIELGGSPARPRARPGAGSATQAGVPEPLGGPEPSIFRIACGDGGQTAPVTDCIFCRIIAGDAPAYVVAEDERTLAFLDRGQATEGHTLVVPRTHTSDIWATSEEDVAGVMLMAKRVAHLLDQHLAPDGLNLTQSNRLAGWQDVFHFHLHVIPRWTGDGLVPPWRPTHPSDKQLAATLRRLQ